MINEDNSNEFSFIEMKYNELIERKGILLLKAMDKFKINKILDEVKEYSDMDAFVIDNNNRQQIVLKYRPTIDETINIRNLINSGNDAYKSKNYNKCIECYLKLIHLLNAPKAFCYAKLGLAYMKNDNIPVAIEYLTVATALSKLEDMDYDFSELISGLKGETEKYDRKPKFKMNQDDYDYSDINNYYGIENFDEINSYIIESGLDVESACKELNMSLEQIDIIKLIYAREFYIDKKFEKGDLFLNSVERSKNKTKFTKRLFNEIKTNRKYYQNRKVEDSRQLVLSLVPKKK